MTRGSRETIRDLGTTAINAWAQLGSLDLEQPRRRERAASWRGFIGGFLLGAVVGMVIALLLAPRRGDETRRLVGQSTDALKGKATGLVHQLRPDAEPAIAQPWREFATEPAIERTFGD